MGNVNTKITGDAQDLIREQKKVAEGAAEVTSEYRELVKESSRLGSVASRAWNETRTPLELYERRVKDLNSALAKGKIDTDTHARAMEVARQRYQEATRSSGMFMQSLSGLAAATAGMVSLNTAISMVSASLDDVHQKAVKAADATRESFGSRGMLAQVMAPGETLDQLRGEAELFQLFGGAGGNRALAQQSVFALKSTGFMGDAQTFRDVGRVGLVPIQDMEPVINALDSLRDAMGQAEVGDAAQMLSKFLVTSTATQVPIPRLAPIAQAAPNARALGLTDEELLASLGAISDSAGGPEEARTLLKNLFNAIEKQGLQGPVMPGQAMQQRMDMIRNALSRGASLTDVLGGSQEAVLAFRLLEQNQQAFSDLLPQLHAANQRGPLRNAISTLEQNPEQMAVAEQLRLEGQRDVMEHDRGTREILRQNMVERIDQLMTQFDEPAMLRWMQTRALDLVSKNFAPNVAEAWFSNQELDAFRERALQENNDKAIEILDQINKGQQQLLQFEIRKQNREDEAARLKQKPKPTVPAPEA